MRKTRTAGAVLLALAVAGSVAACAADDDGAATLAELQASAGASPSLSAEEQKKQEVIDEAQAVLDEYRQLEFDVAHDGYGGWALLTQYWGADLAESLSGVYRDFSDKGRYSTGEAEVVSSEVSDYVAEDAGYEQVEFTVCLNTSDLALFEKGGTEVPLPNDTPEQYVTVYRLAHKGPDGTWKVEESSAHTDREC